MVMVLYVLVDGYGSTVHVPVDGFVVGLPAAAA
jgi:hypothetical protein